LHSHYSLPALRHWRVRQEEAACLARQHQYGELGAGRAASTLLKLLLISRWRGAPHRPVTQNPNVSVIRAFENENLLDVGFSNEQT
jgi:hypothetical protein